MWLQEVLSQSWQVGVATMGLAVGAFAWQQKLESRPKLPVYHVAAVDYGVVNAADELNKTA